MAKVTKEDVENMEPPEGWEPEYRDVSPEVVERRLKSGVGSKYPIPGRCGAVLGLGPDIPARYCSQHVVAGSGTSPGSKARCKNHGGLSSRSLDHWRVRAGQGAKVTTVGPEKLRKIAESAASIKDLEKISSMVDLLYSRAVLLVDSLEESPVEEEYLVLVSALAEEYPDNEIVQKLLEKTNADIATNEKWEEIALVSKDVKALVEGQAKIRKTDAQTLSLNQAIVFKEIMLRAVRDSLEDPKLVRKVGRTMAKYLEADRQIPDMVEAEYEVMETD